MPQRHPNLEHQVAGLAPYVRVGDDFLELGTPVIPTRPARLRETGRPSSRSHSAHSALPASQFERADESERGRER
jgi:hypothetical protein